MHQSLPQLSRTQRTHSIEHRQHRDTDVGENRHPHGTKADRCQSQDGDLDTYGEPDILPCNTYRPSRNPYRLRNLGALLGKVMAFLWLFKEHHQNSIQDVIIN